MKSFSGKETREQLVERVLLENYNRYYRLAYSYVNNGADASDIVQNGAYQAILNSNKLRDVEYASTWLYRIMLNEIFKFCKAPVCEPLDEAEIEQGREDVYEDVDLRKAIESLNIKDKAVIELRYFEDMQLEKIAQVMDENLNTVKSRLYRSLKKLKLKLAEDDDAPKGRNAGFTSGAYLRKEFP